MDTILGIISVCAVIAGTVAQEGKHFLLVFPESSSPNNDGICQIIINTNVLAEVTISYKDNIDYLSVGVGSYIYDIDCEIRAQPAHSDKAVIVDSDVDITVQVYMMMASVGDMYLALPSYMFDGEYILATPPEPCDNNEAATIYSVAAEADDTQVHVYSSGPGGYHFVDTIYMSRWGTYTNTSSSAEMDFTGWKLTSNAPLAVVSGSSCYRTGIGTCTKSNAGYMLSPPTDQAGYRFIIPKIASPGSEDSGAFIRIISFSQSNVIELPDKSIIETIDAGQYYQHHIDTWNEVTRVECNNQCVVMMYKEIMCEAGDPSFVLYVTPLERSTRYTQFTAMASTTASNLQNYITVISQTQNIRLNGVPISGWRWISDWSYYEAALAVEPGGHTLQSNDVGTFVAFVYGHVVDRHFGYGSAIVHNSSEIHLTTTMEPTPDITDESTTESTTGSTASPELPGKVPDYRLLLISDWISDETMVTECVTQYYNQLRQKTVEMAIEINDMIDSTLCSELTTQDVIVASASSSFISSSDSGNALVTFTLSPGSHVLLHDVANCAKVISEHVKPHSTWGEPLLDGIQNCAYPIFELGEFYDGEHAWICVNEKEFEEYNALPSYYIELEDVGTTHDNSELRPECTLRYSLSLDQRAASMRSYLNSLLGTELCLGINGMIVASHFTSFVAQGSYALMHIDFFLNHETLSGGDVLLCAEDILQYVRMYDSWGLPLLPPEISCPDIEQNGEVFNTTNKGWICNM